LNDFRAYVAAEEGETGSNHYASLIYNDDFEQEQIQLRLFGNIKLKLWTRQQNQIQFQGINQLLKKNFLIECRLVYYSFAHYLNQLI
jgi:hypothetical protein